MSSAQLGGELKALVALFQSGHQSEAIERCKALLDRFPGQPDILHLLAIAYAQLNQFELSFVYFEQAVGAAPNRSDFWGNYANACWESGQFERAHLLIEKAVALAPESPEPHNIKGNVLLGQSRFAEAEEAFRSAIRLRPGYAHAQNNLGNALLKLGKNEEAIEVYQALLKGHPDYTDALCNLAAAYRTAGDLANARSCLERALKLRPTLENARAGLAEISPVWSEPLESNRLIIRRQESCDAEFLAGCYSNVAFLNQYNRYVPRFRHPDILRGQLKVARDKHPAQIGRVDWVILRKGVSNPIGVGNLADIQQEHRRAEFLIGIPDQKDHLNGVGLEASLLVLDFAFNRARLKKLTNLVYVDNINAQKSNLSLGFLQESYFRSHIYDSDSAKLIDIIGYGMLEEDFRASKRIAKFSKRLLGRDITPRV